MFKHLERWMAAGVVALALVTVLPKAVYSQAQSLLFGSYNGAAKVVTATSAGAINVTVAGGAFTVPLKLADGTVSAPSLAFASDTTAGFWKAGTSNWSLASNVLRFDNSAYLNGFSSTYYGLVKWNDWGADRGGMELRGMQNNNPAKVHNSAVDINGFTATGTGFPAISLNGGNALDGSLIYLLSTDSLVRICNQLGTTPCDFNVFDVFGAGKIVHQVLDIPNSSHGFGTTSTIGYNLKNGFTATVVDVSEWSPALSVCGSAWKSNATAAAQTDCFKFENQTLTGAAVTTETFVLSASINAGAYANVFTVTSAGALAVPSTATSGGLTPAGTVGHPVVVAYGNTVAATNTGTASIATVTPAVDTTYEVGCNILVTTSTTHSFSCDVTYTDEGNSARTMVLPVVQLAGTFVTTGLITNVTGAGPYESPTMTIRVKASTAVTVRTSAGGTFTTVVYNARGVIKQVS